MYSVEIKLPDSINLNKFELSFFVASKLFEEGRISSGEAAEIVGLSKRAFIESVGKYGISIFPDSIIELYKEIANA